MMTSYLLHPTVTLRQQEDGSFAALGRELPIFVLAPTVQELWERIAQLQPSLERMLEVSADGMSPHFFETAECASRRSMRATTVPQSKYPC